jgi:hypothetical protein
VAKEILEKLCKEDTDIISENPGILAGTESTDLLLSREAMKIQEDGRLKPAKPADLEHFLLKGNDIFSFQQPGYCGHSIVLYTTCKV